MSPVVLLLTLFLGAAPPKNPLEAGQVELPPDRDFALSEILLRIEQQTGNKVAVVDMNYVPLADYGSKTYRLGFGKAPFWKALAELETATGAERHRVLDGTLLLIPGELLRTLPPRTRRPSSAVPLRPREIEGAFEMDVEYYGGDGPFPGINIRLRAEPRLEGICFRSVEFVVVTKKGKKRLQPFDSYDNLPTCDHTIWTSLIDRDAPRSKDKGSAGFKPPIPLEEVRELHVDGDAIVPLGFERKILPTVAELERSTRDRPLKVGAVGFRVAGTRRSGDETTITYELTDVVGCLPRFGFLEEDRGRQPLGKEKAIPAKGKYVFERTYRRDVFVDDPLDKRVEVFAPKAYKRYPLKMRLTDLRPRDK